MNRLNPISRIFQLVLVLLILMFTGIGILIWLTPVPEDQLTQTQADLISVADGMVMITFGAILGLVGARIAGANGKGRAS